jgi:DNA-binding response OmpR family regulator
MRVLIADDDRLVCEMVKQYVLLCGHEVVETVCGGGLSVIQTYGRQLPDVMILDVLMPRLNGFTVCHNVLSRHPEAKVILMSGQVDRSNYSVIHSGAVAYLQKPFGLEELRALLISLDTETAAEPPVEAAA